MQLVSKRISTFVNSYGGSLRSRSGRRLGRNFNVIGGEITESGTRAMGLLVAAGSLRRQQNGELDAIRETHCEHCGRDHEDDVSCEISGVDVASL